MTTTTKSSGPGPDGPTLAPRTLLGWAALLLALSGLALVIDLQVAELCRDRCVWGEVGNLISLSEAFAHGMGVGMIVLTVIVLDPRSRRKLPRLLTLTFGAGLICDLVKILVPRARPNFGELATSAVASFLGWGPVEGIDAGSRFLESGIQSFPSGHATVAAGLAIGLSWMYPRGRWVFLTLAVMAATQRVTSSAHYPSDVLAGAALACVVAATAFWSRGIGGWFNRFETEHQAPMSGKDR